MAENINIREKAKMLWIRSMKTIGNTATNIANNTKFKVDEMTLQNRRRELSGDLSNTVYTLWMKGSKFPPEVNKMLKELQQLDDRLNDMRAEKYALGKGAASGSEDEKEINELSDCSEETSVKEDYSDITVKPEDDEDSSMSETIISASPALQSEINECFDHAASVDKMAEKVNSSLDQLTDKIRSFSPEYLNKGKNKTEETE